MSRVLSAPEAPSSVRQLPRIPVHEGATTTTPSLSGVQEKDTYSLETPKYILSWKGFVYINGKTCGNESVRFFAEELSHNLLGAFRKLKGAYLIVVHDKATGETYASVDGTGLFHAFCSTEGVSSSFLDLARRHHLSFKDASPEMLIEFLHFGYLSFGRTFFNTIKRLHPDQIVRLSPSGKLEFLECARGIETIVPHGSLEELLATFLDSVRNEHISLDLTGGIDSRLLAVIFDYFGIPFELAVSGEETNDDVVIATKLAELLNRSLFITHHEVGNFEVLLPGLFWVCDGLFDVSRSHGPLQLQLERLRRGVTLMVSGVGGELFKDFWWLQDFPLYIKRKPNLGRLYSLRIVPVEPIHDYLTNDYAVLSRSYRARYLQQLSTYIMSGNTQTYDKVYHSVKMRDVVGRFVSNHTKFLYCCTPYLEPEIAAIGYRLARRERFFDLFHRRTITHYRPDIARLSTTQGGMSASAEPMALIVDLHRYAIDRIHRIARKLTQVAFRQQLRLQRPTSRDLTVAIRHCSATGRAFEHLKSVGLLRPELRLQEVRETYLGNILSLGLLLESLDSRSP